METCKVLTHLAANEVLGITSSVRDLKRSILFPVREDTATAIGEITASLANLQKTAHSNPAEVLC